MTLRSRLFGPSRKERFLISLHRRIGEWMEESSHSGAGYIPSHGLYVWEELNSIRKEAERIL
jgi:hypothetical protein